MRKLLRDLKRDLTGATAVEYGLILAFVFLAMIVAVQSTGTQIITIWNNVATAVTGASSV